MYFGFTLLTLMIASHHVYNFKCMFLTLLQLDYRDIYFIIWYIYIYIYIFTYHVIHVWEFLNYSFLICLHVTR